MLEAAGRAQAFDRALDSLGRGAGAGGEALSENWTKELIRLRVPLEQGRADVQKLLATFRDIPGLNVGTTVNDVLKLGAALQLTAEQSKSFNKVFSDTAGKGKIQREELTTQLAEIGIGVTIPGFLQEVSKSTGKAYSEVEKMLSTGKITSEIAVPALIAATLSARGIQDLDAEAAKAAGSATGTLNNLDNAWEQLKTKLGEALIQKGALDQIDRLADSLFRLADNADKVVAALDRLIGVWRVFNGDTTIPASTIIPGGDQGTPLQRFLDLTPNQALEKIGSFWSDFFTAGKNLGDATSAGMAAGMTDGQGAAAAAATGLADSVTGASKSALEIQSPSKVFAEQGRFIDEGLAMGIEDHQDLAFASAESLADGVVAEAEMAAMTGSGVNQTAMANVGTAAGNALGGSAGGAAGGTIGSVNVSINVDGSKDTQTTMQAIRSFFDTDFAALLERQLEGSGA
jgi:tape measure domain-containing protein